MLFQVIKSLGLGFIVSVFTSYYYSQWYCSSSLGRIASGDYSGECYGMTTGLAPLMRAFVLLLPTTVIIFFIMFRQLRGKAANIAGKATPAIFIVGLIIILYSIGILRVPF